MIASIYQIILFLWYCNLEGRLRSDRWRSSRQAATLTEIDFVSCQFFLEDKSISAPLGKCWGTRPPSPRFCAHDSKSFATMDNLS